MMTRVATGVIDKQVCTKNQAFTGTILSDVLPSLTIMRPILGRLTAINARIIPSRTSIYNQTFMHLPMSFWWLAPRNHRRSAPRFHFGISINFRNLAAMLLRENFACQSFRNLTSMFFGKFLAPSLCRKSTNMLPVRFPMQKSKAFNTALSSGQISSALLRERLMKTTGTSGLTFTSWHKTILPSPRNPY